LYDTGFALTLSAPGLQVRYTLDGSTPSQTKGTLYTGPGPIQITKTSVVRAIAYDDRGNTDVITHTYVLKDNYKNEARSGAQWQYKTIVTAEDYGKALAAFPIVSVTSDKEFVRYADYVQTSFEFIASHTGDADGDFVSRAGGKKFGQVSSGQFNSGIAYRFKKDFGTKRAEFNFFEAVAGDAFPTPEKTGKLELHEGQDGPQNDIYDLGYNRYDETVMRSLARDMKLFDSHTKYVHYFFNGQYRGIKTMREDFGANMFEDYFGDDNEYTKVSFQDAYFAGGRVEDGDGDAALMRRIIALSTNHDFQRFKEVVDVEDMIKNQILFMFTDTEREMNAVVHNDVEEGYDAIGYNAKGKLDVGDGVMRMMFNINDSDGAFFNDARTGTSSSAFAGGGGTYRYKWGDSISRRGAGRMFGSFSGDSTSAAAGNLEFKTLVKDQVLLQLGEGKPLSVENVNKYLSENQDILDLPYRLDAAFMGARASIYTDWKKSNDRVLAQTADRVSFNLEQWAKYGMRHTLSAVGIASGPEGYTLTNPNAGTKAYYTIDGSDPMGPDGVVSAAATEYTGSTVDTKKITVRAFTTNNWGPLSAIG
jgi:hypothetical protein